MNTPEERAVHTLGSSTLYNLLEAMIQLSERNQREHKLFTKDLKDVREAMRFHPVMTLGEVLDLALEPKSKPQLHAV